MKGASKSMTAFLTGASKYVTGAFKNMTGPSTNLTAFLTGPSTNLTAFLTDPSKTKPRKPGFRQTPPLRLPDNMQGVLRTHCPSFAAPRSFADHQVQNVQHQVDDWQAGVREDDQPGVPVLREP